VGLGESAPVAEDSPTLPVTAAGMNAQIGQIATMLTQVTRSHAGGPPGDEPNPMDQARRDIEAADARMGGHGLRVLAFAFRMLEDHEVDSMTHDPMSLTSDLVFVDMVGWVGGIVREG
jgi:magnesium-transporting ATPase (P-type)